MEHLFHGFPAPSPGVCQGGKGGVDEMPVPGGGVFPQIPGTDRTGGEDMTSLSVVSYIERINRMYRLIRTESTGSRAELAGRMRVSERTVSNYLEELRLMGADIRFSKTRNTYYFSTGSCFMRRSRPASMPTCWTIRKRNDTYNYNKPLKKNEV